MKINYLKMSAFVVIAASTLFLVSCSKDEGDNAGGDNKESVEKLASDQPGNMNAVLEEYTGVRCTFCPDGHRRAQKFSDENPGKVVLINVHTGIYANPQTGWPDFTTPFGAALATMSQLTGYPSGSMNRHLFPGAAGTAPYYKQRDNSMAMGRGAFAVAGADRLSQPTPVNIGMKSKYNEGSKTATITVQLYYTETETAPNFLNVVVLENNVIGKQIDAGVTKSDYVHNHVLRTMITGQWGEAVPKTTKGERYTKTFTYEVPDGFKAEDLYIAAFVTQEVSGVKAPILNGDKVKMAN